nr:protein kinase-like domain, phloem protein 2-like protein [Tanacetum cinerariifolium]
MHNLIEEFEFENETKLPTDSDAYWETKLPTDLELIINMLEIPPAIYTIKKELFSFLHKGILFDEESKNEGIEGFESLTITDEEDKDNNDAYWEKKLPNDYHGCIDMLRKPLHYTTKKDLYLLFCHGFLGDFGQLWFSLCKATGKICSMLRAIDIVHQ